MATNQHYFKLNQLKRAYTEYLFNIAPLKLTEKDNWLKLQNIKLENKKEIGKPLVTRSVMVNGTVADILNIESILPTLSFTKMAEQEHEHNSIDEDEQIIEPDPDPLPSTSTGKSTNVVFVDHVSDNDISFALKATFGSMYKSSFQESEIPEAEIITENDMVENDMVKNDMVENDMVEDDEQKQLNEQTSVETSVTNIQREVLKTMPIETNKPVNNGAVNDNKNNVSVNNQERFPLQDHEPHLIECEKLQINENGTFDCPFCDEFFTQTISLQEHIQTHSDNTRYRCDIDDCTSKFSEKTKYEQHRLDHFVPNKLTEPLK